MGGKIRIAPDRHKVPLDGFADGLFGHGGV